ncbi:hypothetical protein A3L04_06375 [Thermococcus chitonophagus]|uniref:Uncharacterized protein n=1 Tax=Thermococcus chitonophagus TaxID=54262 RepID=A0A2Z2N7T7_9EURY|nr:hypothetical protein [Thermococcus chitonophagus]ASJ16723.1 hypothetical protein A3L04_06375 [Thermococcus chitonophagus]
MGKAIMVVGIILIVIGMFGLGFYYAASPRLIQEYNLNKNLYVGAGYPIKFIAERGNIIVVKGEGRGPNGELVPVNIMIDGVSNIKISRNPGTSDFFYSVDRTPLMSPFGYSFRAPFTGEFEITLEYLPKDLDKWPGEATVVATISVYDDSFKRRNLLIFGAITVIGLFLTVIGKLLQRTS